MTVRGQWGVVIAILVLLGGGLLAFERLSGGTPTGVAIGAAAPEFTAYSVDGRHQVHHLANYRGYVTIVNVWATWCEPCKAEMPALEQLYRKYRSDGLRIAAVSVDETASDDSVATYARNMGLTFDILHDGKYTIERSYQVVGYPSSYVIDREGRIRAIWLGARDWTAQGVTALVEQLLGQHSGSTAASAQGAPSAPAGAP